METNTENPLFLIARGKKRERVEEGGFDFLSETQSNTSTYTLGFCDGVSYTTTIFQEQIAALQKQISELQKL